MMSLNARRVFIHNASVVTPDGIIEQGAVLLQGERILRAGKQAELELELAELVESEELSGQMTSVELRRDASEPAEASESDADILYIDAGGGWILPGFIDVHVHGGFGSDFMDATEEALDGITRFHGAHGTTTMLATSVTAPKSAIESMLAAVEQYRSKAMPNAQLLGVHLEGPFISPKWPGAQNPNYIVLPELQWLEDWNGRFPGLIRMLTLAPEREGASLLIEWLHRNNIVTACGHTDASYDDIQEAVEIGLQHAVHTFNAMKGLHHREPGTAGAVLTDDRISAEIIADGHHVHPACIRLLTRTKTNGNLILITDAISAAGFGDGTYELGGLNVIVQDGVARLKEGGSLAGSTLTMIDAFRFVVANAGVSVSEASRLASGNPARLLGIGQRTGSLEEGKQADVLLVSSNLNKIEKVWIKGREVF